MCDRAEAKGPNEDVWWPREGPHAEVGNGSAQIREFPVRKTRADSSPVLRATQATLKGNGLVGKVPSEGRFLSKDKINGRTEGRPAERF